MSTVAAGPTGTDLPKTEQRAADVPSWRIGLLWLALTGVVTAGLMTVVYLWDSTSFLVDDKRNQYLPVAMDIGRRLTSGEWLPVIDPNLGISGNFAIDIQYGLFDPSHWLVAIFISRFSNLELAAFVWALLFEIVLAVGTTALARRLRMPGAWAVAAGVAVATSGWVFFKLAPGWMPGLVSLAWLPWVWWAWVGVTGRPRVRDCIGIAVFSYLVIAGGWPSTWLAFGALVVGLVVEAWTRRDVAESFRSWVEPIIVRGIASLAGVVSAALCLVPLYHAAAFTIRGNGIANNNFLTPNLADMVSFAAPQLKGDILTFGGQTTLTLPVYFAVWFAVVVLWCIRWDRSLWRRPGLVTSIVGCTGMVLLTQAPSAVGPLRDQIRQLAGVQFFFAVGVCALACAGPWVVTKLRAGGIGLTLLAMGWVSWSRVPGGVHTVLGTLAVLVAAVLVLYVGRSAKATGALVVAGTVALTLVAFALYHGDRDPRTVQTPVQLTAGHLGLTVADQPIFAAYPPGNPSSWDRWQADGVGRAFSDLRPGARIAPGYSSLGQRAFRARMCITSSQGQGCPAEVTRLFRQEPTTHVPWVDLLGYRTILVATQPLQRTFERVAGPDWHRGRVGTDFTAYRRSGPISVAGRVTHVIGHATVTAEALSNDSQSYQVSSGQGARLVFRDLFWPGYIATLDGHRLPVTPLDHMLVTVALPPGAHGTLTVSYAPLSTKVLAVLPATSVVMLGAACGWVYLRRRRDSASES